MHKYIILLIGIIGMLCGCVSHKIEYALDEQGKPFVDADGKQYKTLEEYRYFQPEWSDGDNKTLLDLNLQGLGL